MGDRFQMRRVHAATVATQMVDFQAIRDRAESTFVGHDVRFPQGAPDSLLAVPVGLIASPLDAFAHAASLSAGADAY